MDCFMAIGQPSRFLPTMRIRKIATILASTTATMPPADALPTSKSRTARGRHENLGENTEQEDRLDEHDDGDRPRDMRQDDIAEIRERARPVERGRLLLLLVERLQGG